MTQNFTILSKKITILVWILLNLMWFWKCVFNLGERGPWAVTVFEAEDSPTAIPRSINVNRQKTWWRKILRFWYEICKIWTFSKRFWRKSIFSSTHKQVADHWINDPRIPQDCAAKISSVSGLHKVTLRRVVGIQIFHLLFLLLGVRCLHVCKVQKTRFQFLSGSVPLFGRTSNGPKQKRRSDEDSEEAAE